MKLVGVTNVGCTIFDVTNSDAMNVTRNLQEIAPTSHNEFSISGRIEKQA